MDKTFNDFIKDIPMVSVIKTVILVLVSIVYAGNILPLYNFLVTIPVLEWVLNIQVLIVMKKLIVLMIYINGIEYFGCFIKFIKFRNKTYEIKLSNMEKMLNNLLYITVCVYGFTIIDAIINNVEITFYMQTVSIVSFLLMILTFGYSFNKWKKNNKLDIQ